MRVNSRPSRKPCRARDLCGVRPAPSVSLGQPPACAGSESVRLWAQSRKGQLHHRVGVTGWHVPEVGRDPCSAARFQPDVAF